MTMNNTLNKIIIFAAGAAVGSAVTWKLVKTKYERIAQEEIESVKEVFSRRSMKENTDEESESEDEESDTMDEYESLVHGQKYAEYIADQHVTRNMKKLEENDVEKPYVIEPEEFGEIEYAEVSYTYWADGVLTDSDNNIVDNIEELIGKDSLTHFGEYEDDSVFVRNDRFKIDFEILRVNEEFWENN